MNQAPLGTQRLKPCSRQLDYKGFYKRNVQEYNQYREAIPLLTTPAVFGQNLLLSPMLTCSGAPTQTVLQILLNLRKTITAVRDDLKGDIFDNANRGFKSG